MRRKARAQKGSVLMTVMVVSMMMMVIITACISLVGHTMTRTNQEYRDKQAYFIASSALEAFVEKVTVAEADGAVPEALSIQNKQMWNDLVGYNADIEISLHGNDVSNYTNRMGSDMYSCNISVVGIDANNVKVVSTAEYLGRTKTVVAYFNLQQKGKARQLMNALELIGTNGGGTGSFENLTVVGNTASSSVKSHDNNVVYEFAHNNITFQGDTTILGSVAMATNLPSLNFYQNQYYHADIASDYAASGEEYMETKGAGITISRSFAVTNNTTTFNSSMVKTSSYTGPDPNDPVDDYYNYINVGNVFYVAKGTGGGVTMGYLESTNHDLDRQFDVYAACIVIGNMGKRGSINAMFQPVYNSLARSFKDYTDSETGETFTKDAQIDKFLSYGSADYSTNSGMTVNGNVYTYTDWGNDPLPEGAGTTCAGNIYVAAGSGGQGLTINGDLYLGGDLWIDTTESNSKVTVNGNLHMSPTSHVYKCAYNNTSGKTELTVTATSSGINDPKLKVTGEITKGTWEDAGVTRTKRPEIKSTEYTAPVYYYLPEHLMLLTGSGVEDFNSSIAKEYASFYKDEDSSGNTDGLYNTLKDHGDYRFTDSDGVAHTVKYLDDFSNMSGGSPVNSYSYDIKFDDGTVTTQSFKPMYYITDSFVFDWNEDGDKGTSAAYNASGYDSVFIIDVDEAAKDIVVILRDGANINVNNESGKFLIRNSKWRDSEGNLKYFVYFVSDSGCGGCHMNGDSYICDSDTVSDNYIADPYRQTVSEYKHAYFKQHPTFSIYGKGSCLMDLDAYYFCHMNDKILEVDPYTEKPYTDKPSGKVDSDYYEAGENSVFILLTEGAEMTTNGNGTTYQASVYGPKAEWNFDMSYKKVVTYPDVLGPQNEGLAVIGCAIVHSWTNLQYNKANGIIYQEAAKNSMLPKTRGSETINKNAYRLRKYDNH